MKQPTSKQPNPPKFKPNNRCLIPFHTASVIVRNQKRTQIVTDRRPGEIIKSNDGKFTYQVQQTGALVKVRNA